MIKLKETFTENSQKIRVLEIISGFAIEGPLGGIERFGIELVQALDKNKIEPIVCGMWAYDTPTEYQWVDRLRAKQIEAFIAADWDEKSPYKSFVHAYNGLLSQVNKPVDIIHSHCQFGDVLALLLKKRLGAKAVVRTVHNEREWGKRPFRRLFLTGGIYPLKFNAELGVSQQVVDNLNARFLARLIKKRAIKAYNALNLTRFETISVDIEKKKRSLNLPVDSTIIGTIGRLTEQKGYTFFINSIPNILEKHPQTNFLIIGYGELEFELKDLVQALGLSEHVVFTGARDDIEEILPIMDVFVNSSLWEGLPTVIMESMVIRVPVVATRVSGNIELIQDGVTGLLVEPKNSGILAEAIIEMLEIPKETQKELTFQAKEFVEKHFSITQIARQYCELYAQLFCESGKVI